MSGGLPGAVRPGLRHRSDGGVRVLRQGRTGKGLRALVPWLRRTAVGAAAAALCCGAPARAAAPTHLAVALLVDTSGSMTQSDPTGSRVVAVRQVAAALGAGDRFALIGFADTPAVLLPLTAMGTPQSLAAVDAAAAKIGASGATDLLGAINTGVSQLATDTDPLDWHVLILITDGVPDLPALSAPAAMAAYEQQMSAAARGIAARGWVLDTVGLGSGVDGAELGQLAVLGDGQYQFAPTAVDLVTQLQAEFSAVQARAQSAPPPAVQAPAAPPPATPLRLEALPLSGATVSGHTVVLPVHEENPGNTPIQVRLAARGLPRGWSLAPVLTLPPGTADVALRLRVGRAHGPVTVSVTVTPSAGATVQPGGLSWRLAVEPAWRAFLRAHKGEMGAGAAGLLLTLILLGYAGYLFRIRPLRRPRGSLEVTAPGGERLGSMRLPRRAEVVVGAAGAGTGVVRLAWVTGEDRLFRIRVQVEDIRRPLWLAGLRAWARPPQAIVFAEAEWPYHLYPGPRPQRRVELYDHTAFGAAGLTFTFRAPHGRGEREAAGSDLLRALDQG